MQAAELNTRGLQLLLSGKKKNPAGGRSTGRPGGAALAGQCGSAVPRSGTAPLAGDAVSVPGCPLPGGWEREHLEQPQRESSCEAERKRAVLESLRFCAPAPGRSREVRRGRSSSGSRAQLRVLPTHQSRAVGALPRGRTPGGFEALRDQAPSSGRHRIPLLSWGCRSAAAERELRCAQVQEGHWHPACVSHGVAAGAGR